MKKLSVPIIDRIDLYVEIYRLNNKEILDEERGDSSEKIKIRVINAREIQNHRFNNEKLNRDMTNEDVEKYCSFNNECENVMRTAIRTLNLSMRTYHKILKVARTIDDLDTKIEIEKYHILEEIKDRKNG